MGKKYFMYTLAVVAIVLTIILISFRSQDPGESLPALVIESTKDIRQYYYDSIPGLIRAEQLGVVKPIHKTFEIPDTDHNLKIDRIWYNSRDAYVFYHVENINEIAYLGGFFSTDDKVLENHINPRDYVGTPVEKGMFLNDNFYSFSKITPVLEIDEERDSQLFFSPTLYIQDMKYAFNEIDLDLESMNLEESIETFSLDNKIEIGEDSISLYKLEAGISYNRIYFDYASSDFEAIYRLKGHLITDRGESFAIDSNSISVSRDKSQYYIEIPPFHEFPECISIQLDSISLIGKDVIHGTIDTKAIKRKNGIHNFSLHLDRVRDTDIILENLRFDNKNVTIGIEYGDFTDKSNDLLMDIEYVFLERERDLLFNTNNSQLIIPNIISIQNNYGKSIETQAYINLPQSKDGDKGIDCIIPLECWEESDEIFITIENPTYSLSVELSIEALLTSP